MKSIFSFCLLALCLLVSCKKDEPDTFDPTLNGTWNWYLVDSGWYNRDYLQIQLKTDSFLIKKRYIHNDSILYTQWGRCELFPDTSWTNAYTKVKHQGKLLKLYFSNPENNIFFAVYTQNRDSIQLYSYCCDHYFKGLRISTQTW